MITLLEKLHAEQRYFDLLMYGAEDAHDQPEGDTLRWEEIPSGQRSVG